MKPLLIHINDTTIHNMDNGVTYINGGDEIHLLGSHQDYIAYGEDAEIFWAWLQSQTMVPKQRTNPQSAPSDEPDVPRRFGLGARVTSINPDLMSRGMTGIVTAITPGRERAYTVCFNGREYDDFAESELEPAD